MPTYSNRLKDIGKYLGFQWKEGIVSGIDSIIWRHKWETTMDEEYKKKIKQYKKIKGSALENRKQTFTLLLNSIICILRHAPTSLMKEGNEYGYTINHNS